MSHLILGDKLKDGFFCSVDVLMCIDMNEFDALNKKDQDYIKFMISAGYIDFCDQCPTLPKFREIFPIGTNTRVAIEALLTERATPPWEPPKT